MSCGIVKFAKGVLNDSQQAMKRNKDYFNKVSFKSIVINKESPTRGKITDYELRLKILKIDSLPGLVNRKYFSYFSFESDKELIISVNENIFNNVLINDTILKEKESMTLIKETGITKSSFNWLSKENKWLE